MAREIYAFDITIPASTAKSLPYTADITMPVRQVDTIEIVVPPGPSGLMGFAVAMNGVNVLPKVAGTFIVTDNETISWPVDGLPTSGDWSIIGYNTDDFDHTIYLRWLVDLITGSTQTSIVGMSTLGQLSSA